MANKTILKWAGSKVRIIEQLIPLLPKTNRLVEPFGGSLAIFMNTEYPRYLISDVNADLINMYRVIENKPKDFIFAAKKVFDLYSQFPAHEKIAREYYLDIRDSFNGAEISLFFRAIYFLYLNRHGFRGLCRYNQSGGFNVPFGDYKKPYFPEQEINLFYRKIDEHTDILCRDWLDALDLVENGDGIYCDPPYLALGDEFTAYHQDGFNECDHEKLAKTLVNLVKNHGCQVTVSNSFEAKELYADLGFTIHEIEAPRTIAVNGNRKPAKEIIAVLNGGAQ